MGLFQYNVGNLNLNSTILKKNYGFKIQCI